MDELSSVRRKDDMLLSSASTPPSPLSLFHQHKHKHLSFHSDGVVLVFAGLWVCTCTTVLVFVSWLCCHHLWRSRLSKGGSLGITGLRLHWWMIKECVSNENRLVFSTGTNLSFEQTVDFTWGNYWRGLLLHNPEVRLISSVVQVHAKQELRQRLICTDRSRWSS